jgi:hypothetical protein
MTPRELGEGHQALLERLYEPSAYFARLFKSYWESPAFRRRRKSHETELGAFTLKNRVLAALNGVRMAARLLRSMSRRPGWQQIARAYVAEFWTNLRFGRERLTFAQHVSLCVHHWHYYQITHDRAFHFGSPIIVARETVTQSS